MTYKKWDVVVSPFPFVDKTEQKRRPVLVLSDETFNTANKHFIGAMITTIKQRSWFGDTVITDINAAGLPIASCVRFKLFTLDTRIPTKRIGVLAEADQKKVRQYVDAVL